jgi:hypothetical protein
MKTLFDKIINFWKTTKNGKLIIIAIILVLLSCVCCASTLLWGNKLSSSPAYKATHTAEEAITLTWQARPTETLVPSNTPQPTSTPTITPLPSLTLSAEEQLQQMVETALGIGNREIPRLTSVVWDNSTKIITANWAINDNLTKNLLIFGARQDVVDVLKTISQANLSLDYQLIQFAGTFSMVDAYGNVSESVVIRASYFRETIQKINWLNFLNDNVFVIADSSYVHPEFR